MLNNIAGNFKWKVLHLLFQFSWITCLTINFLNLPFLFENLLLRILYFTLCIPDCMSFEYEVQESEAS